MSFKNFDPSKIELLKKNIITFIDMSIVNAGSLYKNEVKDNSTNNLDDEYYSYNNLAKHFSIYKSEIIDVIESDSFYTKLYEADTYLDSLIFSLDKYLNNLEPNRLYYLFSAFSTRVNNFIFDILAETEPYKNNIIITDSIEYTKFRSACTNILKILGKVILVDSSNYSETWKIDLMNQELSELNDRIVKVDKVNSDIQVKIKMELENLKNNTEKEAKSIITTFQKDISDLTANFSVSVENQINDLSNKVRMADSDFDATYKDYLILKKMVQGKGEQEITNHYKRKALWERIVYWVMTILTLFIIYKSYLLAKNSLEDYKVKTNIPVAELIQKYKDQPADKIEKIFEAQQNNALTYLILRLALSILLFSTIIYTSRVGYRAYIHMRHSENMRLKLATLKPFINQFKEDERNQVHKDLIPDYFGKDAGLVDNQGEKFKDLPTNISALAAKAIEQVGNNISTKSTTEKNGKKSEDGTE